MQKYTIIRCSKCGQLTIYAQKIATKCRWCNKKIKLKECYKIYTSDSLKEITYLVQRIKVEVIRNAHGKHI